METVSASTALCDENPPVIKTDSEWSFGISYDVK